MKTQEHLLQHVSLQDIHNLSEGQELECKAAQGRDGTGELPHDFWKTYSASDPSQAYHSNPTHEDTP